MADDSLFLIDIDKILREKAPKQSKYIPKFVVSYLKHIVHQEELNVFLRESKDKVGVDFLKACLEFLDANIVVKGEENLPKEGLYTFVSNHPLGGQDGVALGYVLGSFYGGKVKYMVNDLLMNLHGLRRFASPSTRRESRPKTSREWWRRDLLRTISSSCFPQVFVHVGRMGSSVTWIGKRPLS